MIAGLLERAHLDQVGHVHVEPVEDGWRLRFRHDDGLSDSRLADNDPLPSALSLLHRNLPIQARTLTSSLSGERHLVSIDRIETTDRHQYSVTLHGNALTPQRLDRLDMTAAQLKQLRSIQKARRGWIIVGSDASMDGEHVVRAIAQELIAPDRKLVCLEPARHPPLAGVTQIDARTPIATLLALDPDAVCMTAASDATTLTQLAWRATQDLLVVQRCSLRRPSEAIRQLSSLGLPSAWIAMNVPLIVMRHRVRSLCRSCRTMARADETLEPWRQSSDSDNLSAWLQRSLELRFDTGPGCEVCDGQALRGTRDITCLIELTDDVRQALFDGDIDAACRRVDAGSSLGHRLGEMVYSGIISATEVKRHLVPRY